MSKGMLLRKDPYKVYGERRTKTISLDPGCLFNTNDMVYQVRRPDGVIELIPEKVFRLEDYV